MTRGRSGRSALPAAIAAAALLLLAANVFAGVVTGGKAQVSFDGAITPKALPRSGTAPVGLAVSGTVRPLGDERPAGIRRVEVAINRHGVVDTHGLPICGRRQILSSTSRQALDACRDALVGVGNFRSRIDIPEQAPFPALGRLLVFNARVHGRKVLLAHVFGLRPAPTSEVLVMQVRRKSSGQFGSVLVVRMPDVGEEWGFVTGFDIWLKRIYEYRGRKHSFLSASCPAPDGIREVPFKAARGTFYLSKGAPVTRTVAGHCRVTG